MTTTETTTLGAPVWIELAASNPPESIAFYTALLGWTVEQQGDSWSVTNNGHKIGSLVENAAGARRPEGWLVYLLALDVDSTSLAVHSNGGDVYGRTGEMIVIEDSQQAVVGAATTAEGVGHQFSDEAGAPVWHELRARDYDSAIEFYENVFEWEPEVLSDAPEFRYSTLGSGVDALAGIFDASESLGSSRSHWLVYFGVVNADASAARVSELGGSVVSPPTDSEFGRVAHVKDPSGSSFAIIQIANP
jgi:predicted enzyme related to lactoylglutathione lyase